MKKLALFAAAAALLSGPASAEPVVVVIADEPPLPVERVSFDDLNLGSAAGQKRLVWRISRAAGHVCDDSGKMGLEVLVYRKCFDAAFRGGIQQMDQILAARESGTAIATASLTIRRQ